MVVLKTDDPKRGGGNRFLIKLWRGGFWIWGGILKFLKQIKTKFFETGVDEQSGIILKNTHDEMAVMALSMRAKQPKRGVISGTKGYIEISNYPRATEAQITYTASAHEESHETITAGKTSEALEYEIQDMERYIEQGHDDGELSISRDVAHILTSVRTSWGMKYPFDEKQFFVN